MDTNKHHTEEELDPVRLDIMMLILLGIAVLLFVSVIGFCGVIGVGIRFLLFGFFGIGAFAFPVLLFFVCSWRIANRGNPAFKRKLIGIGGVYLFACAICQMVMIGFDPTYSVFQCFLDSAADHLGGGFFGGCVVQLFGTLIGVIGTYIVLIIGMIIFLIILTQKPLYTSMKNRSKEAYEHASERIKTSRIEMQQRRLEAEQERMVPEDEAFRDPAPAEKRKKKKTSQKAGRTRQLPDHGRMKDEHEDVFDAYINGKSRGSTQHEQVFRETSENGFFMPKLEFPDSPKPFQEQQTFSIEGNDLQMPELSPFDAVQPVPDESVPEEPVPQESVPEEYTGADAFFEPDGRFAQADASAPDILSDAKEPYVRDRVTDPSRMREVAPPFRGTDAAAPARQAETFQPAADVPKTAVKKKPPEKPYRFPPVSLLNRGNSTNTRAMTAGVRETAMKLQQTLHNFGVEATVVNASCGPTVTRYELQPDQGVKVSRIVNLADDIKLNLAAPDIRIEAPIPGKAAVGIEVPNQTNNSVALRELIDTPEFKNSKSKLSFAVGKDLAGQPVISDIAKMPHLLIAGSTGSGKSVCMNTLIMSILYKAAPQEVRLMMIDPKVVELSIYNGIPHLLSPVVTDPKKAAGALQWAVAEMTRRYNLFAEFSVRDLKGYNKKAADLAQYAAEDEAPPEILPQIVIIVDELADLMMAAAGEVEEAIVRLTQLARAAGIHLIIATQRPSVNVITGLIKANMPSRIALSVTSGIDSRVIIDMNGAEKLLGKGDMLFYPAGYQKPARVQGAFVSDEEIQKVVEFISRKEVEYDTSIQEAIDASAAASASAAPGGGSERDVYFVEAGRFIIEKDKASIGMLQRMFKIGFNRAARIMDQLCEAGVVGEEEGTKPRKILMSMDEFERLVEEEV